MKKKSAKNITVPGKPTETPAAPYWKEYGDHSLTDVEKYQWDQACHARDRVNSSGHVKNADIERLLDWACEVNNTGQDASSLPPDVQRITQRVRRSLPNDIWLVEEYWRKRKGRKDIRLNLFGPLPHLAKLVVAIERGKVPSALLIEDVERVLREPDQVALDNSAKESLTELPKGVMGISKLLERHPKVKESGAGPIAVLRVLITNPCTQWSQKEIANSEIFKEWMPKENASSKSIGRWLKKLFDEGLAQPIGESTAKRWFAGEKCRK